MIEKNGVTAPPRRDRRIAVIVDSSQGFGRGVLRGVAAWLHHHEPWMVLVAEHDLDQQFKVWLERGRIDGVISRLDHDRLPSVLRKPSIPFVRVASVHPRDSRPTVCSDEETIGRLAADHLADLGFRHLAFCGVNTRWSLARRRGFEAGAAARHCAAVAFERFGAAVPVPPRSEHAALMAWIKLLPPPVGFMAATDQRAIHVLDACRELGIEVPTQAAVVGVDDDDIVCELSTPSLTSVSQDLEQIGYRAAELLASLMAGDRSLAREQVIVPPLGVHVRASTASIAIADSDLRQALELIHAKACSGIDIQHLADGTSFTRRTLERRFQKELGRSIQEEILRTKINAARRLLADTDDKLHKIALATGFTDVASFCHAFKRVTGQRPSDFRRARHPWAADDGEERRNSRNSATRRSPPKSA